jgi:hypothetical protein
MRPSSCRHRYAPSSRASNSASPSTPRTSASPPARPDRFPRQHPPDQLRQPRSQLERHAVVHLAQPQMNFGQSGAKLPRFGFEDLPRLVHKALCPDSDTSCPQTPTASQNQVVRPCEHPAAPTPPAFGPGQPPTTTPHSFWSVPHATASTHSPSNGSSVSRPYSSRLTASVRRPDVVSPPGGRLSMLTRRTRAALVTICPLWIFSG